MKNKKADIWLLFLFVLISVLGLLYVFVIKSDLAGFLYDDGMYLMSAQSLAHGEGYRLDGIAGHPLFYKYPPLYPAVLSALLQITPEFPKNIIYLKSFNVLLSLFSLALLFYYGRKIQKLSPWMAFGIVLLTGTNWRFVEVSTEIMSEPLFFLLSTLAAIAGSRIALPGVVLKGRCFLWLILLSVAAFYTRTIGIVLILAIGIWLYRQIHWKKSVIYLTSCFLLILPWLFRSSCKPNTTYPIGDFLIRTFQETYFQSLYNDLRYEAGLIEIYAKGVNELFGNLSVQFFPLLERFFLYKETVLSETVILSVSFTLGLFLLYYAYVSGKSARWSLMGVYVSLYLLILPFWSFYKFYPRFLIMILPFLWMILLGALEKQIQNKKRGKTVIASIAGIALISNLIHLGPYLERACQHTFLVDSRQDLWADYSLIADYIRQKTSPKSIIYSDNADENYFYALNTGRTALDFFVFMPKQALNRSCQARSVSCLESLIERKAEATYQALRNAHADYLILNRFSIIKNQYNNWSPAKKTAETTLIMMQHHPTAFKLLAQSSDRLMMLYRFQPE